jgi:short-subunit dehydrogenase
MLKPISEQVVVITGASSGIGRETALEFAGRGATVVLTARNQEALNQVQAEIQQMGGRALIVPADVADWNQVQQVAHRATEEYGRIDTWVNNAAVTAYGTFEDIPIDQFRRVIDVNLMGQVNGAKAALPYLRLAGGGSLIGVGSVESSAPMPLQTAYVASKQALKGFYDSLRLEQEHDQTGVSVCLIMPASMDTPLFTHAVSHMGVRPGPMPPVYRPKLAAEAILHAASMPTRNMTVGMAGATLVAAERVIPRLADAYLGQNAFRQQLTDEPASPNAPNNLWQPMPGPGQVHGGWRAMPFDAYTWVRLHPAAANILTGVALAGVVLPLAAGIWRSRR